MKENLAQQMIDLFKNVIMNSTDRDKVEAIESVLFFISKLNCTDEDIDLGLCMLYAFAEDIVSEHHKLNGYNNSPEMFFGNNYLFILNVKKKTIKTRKKYL